MAVFFELGLVPSRLILNAVPKPASECEELDEISHVPSPCAAHLRILSSLSSIFAFYYFPVLAFVRPSCLLLTGYFSSSSSSSSSSSPYRFFALSLLFSSLNSGPDRWTGQATPVSRAIRFAICSHRAGRGERQRSNYSASDNLLVCIWILTCLPTVRLRISIARVYVASCRI